MKHASLPSVQAADLFCGAGGTSTGLLMACNDLKLSLDLLAVNHWNVAIETHKANHPYARHLCESADNVDPRKVVPSGRLRIFVASPECTHHSNARGGRPMNDQSRASAWHVLRWAEALYIDNIIIENVKEFRSWGPLGASGRPIKRLKGQLYLQFLASLRALGYTVEDRVLNCADYGDPTTRERLFIIARRGKKITWPQASHCDPAKLKARRENGNGDLFKVRAMKPWVAAREIIDWQLPSQSIFARKKPLARKTLERIYAGFQKFNSPAAAEPYLIVLRQHMGARSLDRPLPTLVGKNARQIRVCEPVLIPFFGEREGQGPRSHSVDDPLPTVTGHGAGALAEAFIVDLNHGIEANENPEAEAQRRVQSVDRPLPTVTTNRGKGVVEPYIVKYNSTGSAYSVEQPIQTISTKDRYALVTTSRGTFAIDIRLRMLKTHELAAAHSVRGYILKGKSEEQVKQIGNMVPAQTARALCRSVLA